MSRVARVVVPGFPHHVTQRGNRRSDVFEVDADREAYLRFLKKYAARHGLAVWAYCLMNNHVHLVVVPTREESLGLALRDTHTVYAMYFNARTELDGHLWQGRFYSCPMDDSHLWAAVRYVERNPVRAGLVDRSEDYRWSSAAAHCGLQRDPLLSGDFPPAGVVENWSEWLSDKEDAAIVGRIRTQTHTGRPCGSATFFEQIEGLLQRDLQPNKRGRKPGNLGTDYELQTETCGAKCVEGRCNS
jgi:putative transposase